MKTIIAFLIVGAACIAQTTVTLGGSTYTLRDHPRVYLDGPGGTLTTAMTSAARLASPIFTAITTDANSAKTACTQGPNAGSYNCLGPLGHENFNRYTSCAIRWMAKGSRDPDPDGDLDCAKWGVNHIEDYLGGNPALCDETKRTCGLDPNWGGHYNFTPLEFLAQLYSIVHDKLTPTERQAFADKVLNDKGGQNGLGMAGDASASCTAITPTFSGTATLSAVTNDYLTGSGFSALTPGNAIFIQNSSNGFWYDIGTIQRLDATTPDTKLYLYGKSMQWIVGPSMTGGYLSTRRWQTGDCGILYQLKHSSIAPPIYHTGAAGNYAAENAYATDYPGGATYPGGAEVWGNGPTSSSVFENRMIHNLAAMFLMANALADDDARARTLMTKSYNYWARYIWPWFSSTSTGFTSMGGAYSLGFAQSIMAEMAVSLKNSVISGPDISTTVPIYKMMPQVLYTYQLNKATSAGGAESAESYGDAQAAVTFAPRVMRGLEIAQWLWPNDDQSKYLRYYLWVLRPEWKNGTLTSGTENFYLAPHYIFNDPSAEQVNVTNAPRQYLFATTQETPATCTAPAGEWTWGLGPCYDMPFHYAASRSGWTATDTSVLIAAGPGTTSSTLDHTKSTNWGLYHISKNARLLTGDSAQYASDNDTKGSDMTIEVGGSAGWMPTSAATMSWPVARIIRWAGTNPTGVASGDYSYTEVDLRETYATATGVTRANRAIVHLKKASQQDYVVSYDDVAASVSQSMRSYWHWRITNGTTSGKTNAALYDNATLTPASLTGQTVIGTSARLNSKFLSAGPQIAMVVDNADGSYAGNYGFTARAYVCPSGDGSTCTNATAYEAVAVHMPTTNVSATMPTLTQPTVTASGSTATAVQIADASSPAVVVFARGGVTATSMGFTSTHSGTAQYVIAGLRAGTYSVTVGGVSVLTDAAVADGDNTLYFESTAGAVSVNQTGGVAPTIATASLPNGQVGVAYSSALTAYGDPTITFSATGLPDGLAVTNQESGVGLISGTPTTEGSYTIHVTASNAYGTPSRDFPVTIAGAPPPPPSLGKGMVGAAKVTGAGTVR